MAGGAGMAKTIAIRAVSNQGCQEFVTKKAKLCFKKGQILDFTK